MVGLAVTLGALAVSLSGCSWREAIALGWPKGITPEAHVNYDLWIYSVIAAFVIGGIVYALMFWTSAFHRKKATDNELP
ncbi:MAG TPA: cytochrome C oxidase subunit II, partial [Mycobacterium sp.]